MSVKTADSVGEDSLAINLANTLVSDQPGRDLLRTERQLRQWLRNQSAWIDTGHATGSQLEEFRELRSIIRNLFASVINGQRPRDVMIRALNGYAALGPTVAELEYRESDGFAMQMRLLATDKNLKILARIADSAIELLAGPDSDRLGACAGPSCLLYFVAAHPARRWCDSKVCGNRVRVARHAKRVHRPQKH